MIGDCLRGAAAAAFLLLASCPRPTPREQPQRVITVIAPTGCIREKRPEPKVSFRAVVNPDGSACYPTSKDSNAAALYMEAMERWIDNAIIDCSEPAADAGVQPQEK